LPIHRSALTGGTLDIVNTPYEYIARFENDDFITGTGKVLAVINPNSSCERIAELRNFKK
jgi:hypothetical protein